MKIGNRLQLIMNILFSLISSSRGIEEGNRETKASVPPTKPKEDGKSKRTVVDATAATKRRCCRGMYGQGIVGAIAREREATVAL